MSRYYWLRKTQSSHYTGYYNASHKWALPGVHCPQCATTWAGACTGYPSADLSSLAERENLTEARPEPYDEFVRLRELVQSLVPAGAQLIPGTSFGPLQGTASGQFEPILLQNPGELLMRREALEGLQAAGLSDLQGYHTELRFRQKRPPELLEIELMPHGQLHLDCFPERPAPCSKCGRVGLPRPEEPVLERASLPADTNLFRLRDFETMLVCTERFHEAVLRLKLDGLVFRELPVK